MKNKIMLIVSLVMIIAGSVLGYFVKFEAAQLSAFAVTMLGAGLACATLWSNKKEGAKNWLVILSMVLIGLGAFLAGLMGVISESQIQTIITGIFAGIAFIAGIITAIISAKSVTETTETTETT